MKFKSLARLLGGSRTQRSTDTSSRSAEQEDEEDQNDNQSVNSLASVEAFKREALADNRRGSIDLILPAFLRKGERARYRSAFKQAAPVDIGSRLESAVGRALGMLSVPPLQGSPRGNKSGMRSAPRHSPSPSCPQLPQDVDNMLRKGDAPDSPPFFSGSQLDPALGSYKDDGQPSCPINIQGYAYNSPFHRNSHLTSDSMELPRMLAPDECWVNELVIQMSDRSSCELDSNCSRSPLIRSCSSLRKSSLPESTELLGSPVLQNCNSSRLANRLEHKSSTLSGQSSTTKSSPKHELQGTMSSSALGGTGPASTWLESQLLNSHPIPGRTEAPGEQASKAPAAAGCDSPKKCAPQVQPGKNISASTGMLHSLSSDQVSHFQGFASSLSAESGAWEDPTEPKPCTLGSSPAGEAVDWGSGPPSQLGQGRSTSMQPLEGKSSSFTLPAVTTKTWSVASWSANRSSCMSSNLDAGAQSSDWVPRSYGELASEQRQPPSPLGVSPRCTKSASNLILDAVKARQETCTAELSSPASRLKPSLSMGAANREGDPISFGHGTAVAAEDLSRGLAAAEQRHSLHQLRVQQKQRRQRLAQPRSRASLHEQYHQAQQQQQQHEGAREAASPAAPAQQQQAHVLAHPVALSRRARRKSAVGCEATGVCMMGSKQQEQAFGSADPSLCATGVDSKHFSDIVVFNDQVLGKCAYSTVFAGRYRGHPVAVKMMQDEFVQGPSRAMEIDLFKREVSYLCGVRHPHVSQLFGACLCPPYLFLIEEPMPTTLSSLVHLQPETPSEMPLPAPQLTVKQALGIALDISKGLEYLHTRSPPIIHRALKADNIFLDENLRAKVSDYGLARCKYQACLKSARKEAGNLMYYAPECYDPELGKLTEKVDIFALGVLMWSLVTRSAPWQGRNAIEFLQDMVVDGARLPIPSADEVCPMAWRCLIGRCWCSDPAERPSASEIVHTLTRLHKYWPNA